MQTDDGKAAPGWRTSSHSVNNGACAEVGTCGHGVAVRDSKLGDASPVLSFGASTWERFTAALKDA